MMRLYSRGDPIDQLTLTNELRSVNEFERVGGRPYVFQIVESVPTAANAGRYAEIVRGKALLRAVIDVGSRITEDAFREPENVSEALDSAEQLIYGVSNQTLREHLAPSRSWRRGAGDDPTPLRAGGRGNRVETGFEDLDRLTTGFHKSDLVILAARPCYGKDGHGPQRHLARGRREEDACGDLLAGDEQGAAGAEAHLADDAYPGAGLEERQRQGRGLAEAGAGVAEVSRARSGSTTRGRHAHGDPGQGPPALKPVDAQGETPLSLVVVDYLQLMIGGDARNRQENRQQEIAEISRGLKVLARDLDVPVLAIAQLSRAVESRHDKRPMLSDLATRAPSSRTRTW
jgi:replicative DNA helicase